MKTNFFYQFQEWLSLKSVDLLSCIMINVIILSITIASVMFFSRKWRKSHRQTKHQFLLVGIVITISFLCIGTLQAISDTGTSNQTKTITMINQKVNTKNYLGDVTRSYYLRFESQNIKLVVKNANNPSTDVYSFVHANHKPNQTLKITVNATFIHKKIKTWKIVSVEKTNQTPVNVTINQTISFSQFIQNQMYPNQN